MRKIACIAALGGCHFYGGVLGINQSPLPNIQSYYCFELLKLIYWPSLLTKKGSSRRFFDLIYSNGNLENDTRDHAAAACFCVARRDS
jgi:hypothetical protein